MDVIKIEKFLQEYQFVITILLIPVLGLIWSLVKLGLNKIIENAKKIVITFTAESSIENPNYCFTSLEIVNNRSKKLIGDKVEIIMYDKDKEYCLNLYSERFTIESESVVKINLEKVSHYSCSSEFIDFRQLICSKQFYFNIYNNQKCVYSDKKFSINLKRKPRFTLKPFTSSFEGVVHSFMWDYGFIYKDKISNKQYVGFMNKRQVFCPHFVSDALEKDYFTPSNLMQIIEERGGKDIIIKKLTMATDKYRNIETRKLGNVKDIKKIKGSRENPIILTENDILNLNLQQQDL